MNKDLAPLHAPQAMPPHGPEYALIASARIEAAKVKPAPEQPQLGLFGEVQAA